MEGPAIATRDEWLTARLALLEKEKALTRARDALAAERRQLPMVKVDKSYVFDTPDGPRTLAELFDGRSQLVVYHFMFAPGWVEGCPSCSLLGDHLDPSARPPGAARRHGCRRLAGDAAGDQPLQAADGMAVHVGLIACDRLQS